MHFTGGFNQKTRQVFGRIAIKDTYHRAGFSFCARKPKETPQDSSLNVRVVPFRRPLDTFHQQLCALPVPLRTATLQNLDGKAKIESNLLFFPEEPVDGFPEKLPCPSSCSRTKGDFATGLGEPFAM
jgi:hypothetical protein